MSINISVIVPVYNSENCLKLCVNSILNQTLINLELILVDDGSTDGSGRLCDEFAAVDSRIKVIHSENVGPASARNLGLHMASGEYIGFADSDDWLEPEMFESLYKNATVNNSDLTFCNFISETASGHHNMKTYSVDDCSFSSDDIRTLILPYFFGYIDNELKNYKAWCPFADYCSYIWVCIYKTEMIKSSNIFFLSEKIYYNEDNLFNLDAIMHASRISHIGKFLYHYSDNSNSLTKNFNKDYWKMKLNKYTFLSDYIKVHKLNDIFNRRLSNKICLESISIVNYYASAKGICITKKYGFIDKFVNSHLISSSLSKFDFSCPPFSETKIFLFLEKQKNCFLLLSICLTFRTIRTLKIT